MLRPCHSHDRLEGSYTTNYSERRSPKSTSSLTYLIPIFIRAPTLFLLAKIKHVLLDFVGKSGGIYRGFTQVSFSENLWLSPQHHQRYQEARKPCSSFSNNVVSKKKDEPTHCLQCKTWQIRIKLNTSRGVPDDFPKLQEGLVEYVAICDPSLSDEEGSEDPR